MLLSHLGIEVLVVGKSDIVVELVEVTLDDGVLEVTVNVVLNPVGKVGE